VLAIAAAAGPGSRAAESEAIRLYYVPGNWAQSFNGVEAQFSTIFTDKAAMTDQDLRSFLLRDGSPVLLLSCGRAGASVQFREPAGRESISDHPGTLVFQGDAAPRKVTLAGLESGGRIVAKPAASAKDVIDLAGLIGANAAFSLTYQRRDHGAVAHYLIAPAQMSGDAAGGTDRAESAASFGSACADIAAPGTATRGTRS
jgi:hypothetical protein